MENHHLLLKNEGCFKLGAFSSYVALITLTLTTVERCLGMCDCACGLLGCYFTVHNHTAFTWNNQCVHAIC